MLTFLNMRRQLNTPISNYRFKIRLHELAQVVFELI